MGITLAIGCRSPFGSALACEAKANLHPQQSTLRHPSTIPLATNPRCVYNRAIPTPNFLVPDPGPNPPAVHRRWTVIASGLLVAAVGLIVIFTGRAAFHSLAAVVVMAAIGLAAVLLQLHLRNSNVAIHVPNWLNVIGLLCAVAALFADWLRLGPGLA